MRRVVRLSIFLLITLVMYSCVANKHLPGSSGVIKPIASAEPLREGSIVYGLPRTVFTIVVEMERTIELPGPYAKYAGDLLGLDNVIQNENEYWSVERITVKNSEELDPSEFYVIESNTLFQTNVLTLKKEGLILDLYPGNSEVTDNQADFNKSDASQFLSPDLGSDEYFQLQRDTAYKRVNIDSSFIRIPYVVEKKKLLTVDQLAEKAARRLMEMRDGKHLILTGEANVFPQNEAAIIEMNRIEKEYTELFIGKTIREKRTYTTQIIPSKEMIGKPVELFQFSELTGPSNDRKQSGKPVIIEFTPEQKTKDVTIISKSQSEGKAPKYDKLFYRIPDVANLKISVGSDIIFNSRRLVYQFGKVIQLPANYIIWN